MSTNHELRRVRSEIRPEGGLMAVEQFPLANEINPDETLPYRLEHEGKRYQVSARVLGRLEALARTRFKLAKLTNEMLDAWKNSVQSVDTRKAVAQSVLASAEIEGEGVLASEVPLFLNAATATSGEVVTEELSNRIRPQKDIFDAYIWALTLDRKSYLDFDLLLELHQRMFVTSKPQIAGRLKDQEVQIVGGSYKVRTLPAAKAPTYLRELCDRTNRRLINAKKNADEAMLFVVAEFITDFLAIHPFTDGNGRLARLMSTYLLERSGYKFARFYPLDLIILESRDQYYRALYEAQVGWYGPDEDLTPWIEYYVKSIYVQCQRALQLVADKAVH